MQNAPLLALFAHEGNEDMVGLLIEFGADVNCRYSDQIFIKCVKYISKSPLFQIIM